MHRVIWLLLLWILYLQGMHQSGINKLLLTRPTKHRTASLVEPEVRTIFPTASRLCEGVFMIPDSSQFDASTSNTLLACARSLESILVKGQTAEELVEKVDELHLVLNDNWGLHYESMLSSSAPSRNFSQERRIFSSKSLLCRIAQAISGKVALDPRDCTVVLTVLETPSGFFLCRRDHDFTTTYDALVDTWNKRSFQYSAALHVDIALPLVSILKVSSQSTCPVLLDPCCGSGTNLFVARRYVPCLSPFSSFIITHSDSSCAQIGNEIYWMGYQFRLHSRSSAKYARLRCCQREYIYSH